MNSRIQLGDLIAALFDEAKNETNDKRIQSILVVLALDDLRSQKAIRRERTMAKRRSAA